MSSATPTSLKQHTQNTAEWCKQYTKEQFLLGFATECKIYHNIFISLGIYEYKQLLLWAQNPQIN